MELKKIILVFKTHFDIGFTDLSSEVIRKYAQEMLPQVIETCRQTADLGPLRYVWTMPAWPLSVMLAQASEENRLALKELIQNGQIVWHALPFTSHTDLASAEELLRELSCARELSRRFDLPAPLAAKMTDVPGHTWELPDVLATNGIDFLHLGCNEFSTPPTVPDLFFWEAPSGRRVLTMYSAGGYGTGLIPPKDWPYPVWLALMPTHDNCGPQSASMLLSLQEEARRLYPDAEIVCGSLDDFYRELSSCSLDDVPVIRKDFSDTWIHGVGSYPKETGDLMQARRLLLQADRDDFVSAVSGCFPDKIRLDRRSQASENLMLFEEHTWGADVKTFLGPNRAYTPDAFDDARQTKSYRFMEQSWNEQRKRAEELLNTAKSLSETITIEPTDADSLTVKQIEPDRYTAENEHLRIVFSVPDGIECIESVQNGQVLLQASENCPVLGYRYDRYSQNDIDDYLRAYGYHFRTWGIQDFGRENYPLNQHETLCSTIADWRVEKDELIFILSLPESRYEQQMTRFAGKAELRLHLPKTGDSLTVTLTIRDKQATPLVESGTLTLPLGFVPVDYMVHKSGVSLRPMDDIGDGANHSLLCTDGRLTAKGVETTVFFDSLHAPLYSIGAPKVYHFAPIAEKPEENSVFLHLYNNMWGTNFPQWIEGNLRFTLQISTKTSVTATEPDQKLLSQLTAAGISADLPSGMKFIGCRDWNEDAFTVDFQDVTGATMNRELQIPGFIIEPAGSLEVGPYGVQSYRLTKIPAVLSDEDRKLALTYAPDFLYDTNEPFQPEAVGVTVFRQNADSPSAPRHIRLSAKNAVFAIEYAVYYDFDIQHLYDLEHAYVYVGEDGNVCGCECSFHGMFMNAEVNQLLSIREGKHVQLFVQPGKHALMPNPTLFHLFSAYDRCTTVEAGKDGILTPGFIPGLPIHSAEDDQAMELFIKKHWSFKPADEYKLQPLPRFVSWPQLAAEIPDRIRSWMEVCEKETKN